MLSPTVRAAAAQFATDQLGTPHIKALEGAYLTGYCRGYQAKGERRAFPLAGQRELLRTLGPYLAEGIDIFHPATGQYGRLLGLPAVYSHEPFPVADVEMYVSAEGQAEGCGNVIEHSPDKILPVLYGFEDLATEMLLPDGRRGVPAVEVAKLLANDWAACYRYEAELRIIGDCHIECFQEAGYMDENEETICSLFILKDWNFMISQGDLIGSKTLENILEAYQLLQQMHFAVGLGPDQYHRKQVAALGPEPLTFGEPLPPVTPCPSGRNDCPSGCPKCPVEMEVPSA